MTDHQADVLIIGGGIVGCSAAYYLAKRGASAILLEKNGIGSGASGLVRGAGCSMGRCQGRTCGPVAAQLVAAEAGTSLESAGTFKARIPIKPVPLAVGGAVEEARPTGSAMEDHVGYGKAVVR